MFGKLYVEYAISFGVEQYEGLWKIQFLHPYDANHKVSAWIPMDFQDERIGKKIDDIPVAEPGPRLHEVMEWLYARITRYPYYWPWEGTYIDKFGYDFEVGFSGNDTTRRIEITQVAYDIVMEELGIQPEGPDTEREVDMQYDWVPGGGALVKLNVTLESAQPVSEITIVPFSKYPIEVASLMYEEDIETFHPKKEILIKNVDVVNTMNTIRFQFPVVIAKRITMILRQVNYEKNSYTYNSKELAKKELWDLVSIPENNGFPIYEYEMKKYKEEFQQWKKEMDLYYRKQMERKNQQGITVRQPAATELSEYRGDFKRAIQKYEPAIAQFESENGTEYVKYDRSLVLYNKYLREYAPWRVE